MNLKYLLNNLEGRKLDLSSTEYQFTTSAISGILKNHQEVADLFSSEEHRKVILEYQNSNASVKVNGDSPDDLYIKGLVDGMRVYCTLINHFRKTNEMEKIKIKK